GGAGMGRDARRLEPLDDDHAAAAMWAGMVNAHWACRFLAHCVLRWLACRIDLACRGDELASTGDLLGAGVLPIGEQAVVSDAVESLGQHVHEEPADELAWGAALNQMPMHGVGLGHLRRDSSGAFHSRPANV